MGATTNDEALVYLCSYVKANPDLQRTDVLERAENNGYASAVKRLHEISTQGTRSGYVVPLGVSRRNPQEIEASLLLRELQLRGFAA